MEPTTTLNVTQSKALVTLVETLLESLPLSDLSNKDLIAMSDGLRIVDVLALRSQARAPFLSDAMDAAGDAIDANERERNFDLMADMRYAEAC